MTALASMRQNFPMVSYNRMVNMYRTASQNNNKDYDDVEVQDLSDDEEDYDVVQSEGETKYIPNTLRKPLKDFSEAELERYENFKRSCFNHTAVRKIITTVTGCTKMPKTVPIVVGGVTKVFVGQLIEKSLDVMQQWGETGPIRPKHIREAYRLLQEDSDSFTLSSYKVAVKPLFSKV